MEYAKSIEMDLSYDEAVPRVKEAFKAKGFGTLTEIDVRSTLKEKIGEQVEPYLIIGACNPHLAHRALGVEPEVGTLLPCNVVVRQSGDGVVVHALNPTMMASVSDNPALRPIAEEAARLIDEALSDLVSSQAAGGRSDSHSRLQGLRHP